jgi:ankyrin repeat protein
VSIDLFLSIAMHGSVEHAKKYVAKADVHQKEATSGRTALHKAAFWGHIEMVTYLVKEAKLDINAQVF